MDEQQAFASHECIFYGSPGQNVLVLGGVVISRNVLFINDIHTLPRDSSHDSV